MWRPSTRPISATSRRPRKGARGGERMNSHWRLAFMLDAPGGDLDGLEASLVRASETFQRRVGDAHLRLGIADLHPDLGVLRDRGDVKLRSVGGAVEVTL